MTPTVTDQLETLTPAPPPVGPMAIATLSCPQPDTTMCRITGSVDFVTAPVLADQLIEAVRDGRPHVVIDLSAVAVLDSIGLRVVFEALDRYDIKGHLAVVADPRSLASSTPDSSALDEVLDIHHDLASALRACARASISHGGRHRAAATN
ncbi:MAG: STAS domain-containing protein [Pseudonocardiaceae bacterium]|jgi:anti-anti-sigma factor